MAKDNVGCARPISGTVSRTADNNETTQEQVNTKEVHMAVQVGKKAPDFEAPAYHNGEFTSVKLSDYAGKWVLLCFYPGDFTFV